MFYVFCLLIALVLPEAYFWHAFVKGSPLLWRVLFWLPLVLLMLTLAASFAGYFSVTLFRLFIFLLLCIILPESLFAVVSLLGRVLSPVWTAAPAVARVAAWGVALATCGLFIYGMVDGWKRVTVTRLEVASRDLPAAFDGYKVVQLSDFHIGTYQGAPSVVDSIVARVNALSPDVVVFTGDMVNHSPDEMTPFMDVLRQIEARDGVYAILGNHDYCTYRRYDTPDGAARSLAELKRREKKLGWDLLLNENRILRRGGDSIALVGVENDGKPPFPKRADLPRALRGLPQGMYKILLTHDPTHWRAGVLKESDAQLTLSGHTHGMQLKLFGFSPVAWIYDEWGGLYAEGGRWLNVSLGTGSNIPFRVGAWPEICLIRLRTAE